MDKSTRKKATTIVIMLVIVLTYLLPTNKVVKYDFLVGQQWENGTLVAPFDFPIHKTDKEYMSEVDGYKDTFIPIYKEDLNLKDNIVNALISDFDLPVLNDSLAKLSKPIFAKTEHSKVANKTLRAIDEIYKNGVISISQDEDKDKHRDVVRVLKGDEISIKLVKNIYTISQAKAILKSCLRDGGFDTTYIEKYTLDKYIRPNIIYDEILSGEMLDENVKKISTTKGFVTEGTIIINDGDIVSPQSATTLENLNREYSYLGAKTFSILPYVGNFIYLSLLILISCFSIFLLFSGKTLKLNAVLFIATLYILMTLFCSVIYKIPSVSIYVVPLAIVPFYLSQFFGSRVAIIQYTFILLICATYASQPFEFIIFNLIAGVAGVYFLRRSYRRNAMFLAVLATFISYIAVYLAFTFMRQQEIVSSDLYMVMWFAINVLLLLVFLQLTFIFEKSYHFVTKITLVELCDTNQKLLKELSEKAPGTFQHSLQVANIAEEATAAIGGNTLLARTGAMYHDIGKMANPGYFVENVRAEESNHDSLSPVESAKIINSHVLEGMVLARKYALPSIVSDFIATHHGDSIIRYFYHKQVEAVGAENVNIADFQYVGPSPSTKEQTICMIVDSVEAAARTLKTHDRESIAELVNSIISTQQSSGQYRNSPLTFNELERVKEVIISKTLDVYHARVVYPK
ncbi:MAG: HDIG domain-containing protein [Rikenellaceae bacterium]